MSCLASPTAERCQLASFILAPFSTLQPLFFHWSKIKFPEVSEHQHDGEHPNREP